MTIREKLVKIQTELKAPKGQTNDFGKYKYRSLEDIMEAVKPILSKVGVCLVVEDDVKVVADRIYIVATARLMDADGDGVITAQALARESLSKKGMDESQITGTASSYARKYCLNGLFAIDDTKDADSMDNSGEQVVNTIDNKQAGILNGLINESGTDMSMFMTHYSINKLMQLSQENFKIAIAQLQSKIKKANK